MGPRAAALRTADPFSDITTVKPCGRPARWRREAATEFPAIDADLLDRSCWHDVVAAPFDREQPIHMLEARAILAAIRRSGRWLDGSSFRQLLLTDSLCCALAFSKGRATNHQLLQMCRQKVAT